MAEIISSNDARPGRQKLSTRVDLTPMVDLGFLLITFFIFTTSMAHPTALKLILPDDSKVDVGTQVSDKKTLSLILGDNSEVYCYKGFLEDNMQIVDDNVSDLRRVINKVSNEVAPEFGDRKETVILIKPTNQSSYKNVVDILDEMTINGITRYMMVEPSSQELTAIKDLRR